MFSGMLLMIAARSGGQRRSRALATAQTKMAIPVPAATGAAGSDGYFTHTEVARIQASDN
ncbi:hypothetical protein INR49_024212, partial [Caranx melampygus]